MAAIRSLAIVAGVSLMVVASLCKPRTVEHLRSERVVLPGAGADVALCAAKAAGPHRVHLDDRLRKPSGGRGVRATGPTAGSVR